jgi:hypothetical protein
MRGPAYARRIGETTRAPARGLRLYVTVSTRPGTRDEVRSISPRSVRDATSGSRRHNATLFNDNTTMYGTDSEISGDQARRIPNAKTSLHFDLLTFDLASLDRAANR